MDKHIKAPISKDAVKDLQAGDYVYITGTIYTARDAAHKRMYEAMMKGEEPPLDLRDNIIYYLGPTPAREGQVIGSAGPTTSSRMDKYAPLLMEHGLSGMIGTYFTIVAGIAFTTYKDFIAITTLYLSAPFTLIIAFDLISVYNVSEQIYIKYKKVKERK